MATYYEFKQMIGKIFGQRNVGENNDDIEINLQNRYSTTEGTIDSGFLIRNDELQELYDKVNVLSSDNMELFSTNYYEIAIDLDYPYMRSEQYPIISEDIANGIKYTLGYPSIEYCAFLLIRAIDFMNNQNSRRILLPMRFARLTDIVRRFGDDEKSLSLQELLPRMIRELSLKIETSEVISFYFFRRRKTSFIFQFMYRSGLALIEFSDIDDMLHINRPLRGRIDFEQLDTPPFREYLGDVVDYYKMALSAPDPYINFISFYHVMEYFYDEVFRKKLLQT